MLSTMKFRRTTARTAAWTAPVLVIGLSLASCAPGANGPQPQEEAKGEIEFSAKTSPLTGLDQSSTPANPVYYVKIENTHGGEPQYGENHADMMIEELVENGATRCIGLFYSDLPTKIGH